MCQVGRLIGEQRLAALEEIDLSDRRGLVAMAEAYANKTVPPAGSLARNGMAADPQRNGVYPAGSTPIPPKAGGDGRISLTKPQVLFAVIFVVGAVLAGVIITYVVMKQHRDGHLLPSKSATHGSGKYDDSYQMNAGKPFPEQPDSDVDNSTAAEEPNGPTAEELRLSSDLVPIWYNLSMKVYVPGFVPIAPEKNLTFDAALIIKFRAEKTTKKIELNSLKLNFRDVSTFEILEDVETASRQRRAVDTSMSSSASSNGTSFGNQTLMASDDADADRRGSHSSSSSSEVAAPQESDRASGSNGHRRVATNLHVTSLNQNETLEKLVLELDGELKQGHIYYLKFTYSGPIDTKLSGLYLTQYTTSNGKQRYAAVTQMEPTDARRMVPCFDEPQLKAIWRLRVIHPVGSKAVSNAIEIKEDEPTDDPDWLLTTFEETLPMSSYLLAMVVSDFEYVEGHTKRNTRFRIWARRDALNETDYALAAGIKVLEYYEDYYDIPFPLPKQDMMAFPDFGAGAMENWGLVTYREKYLLYNPKLYTSQQKLHVATVVAHELAHQWFGNLVTMKWWSDLWLNEGFATLMEYVGANAISDGKFRSVSTGFVHKEPDLVLQDEYFVFDALDGAFDRDSRATSHPLYFEISKAEDVSEAFDQITYDKGGSVLRMIRAIMGEENFKKGLNIYLNRYKYGNAEHQNLWTALSEAVPNDLKDWSGEKFDVNEFAKFWTKQMGYPVIEVKRVDDDTVELCQKRFKLDETAVEKTKFKNAKYWYKWDVPIWYTINGTKQDMIWLHENADLKINKSATLVVNSDSDGFYRVQYSPSTLEKINQQLMVDHEQFSIKSRARIIDDTFTLAEAGRVPYQAALNLTKYLSKEKEFLPWIMALDGLGVIQNYFDDEPEIDDYKEYITPLVADLFSRISFDKLNVSYLNDDRFFENLLDYAIIGKMCSLRDQQCIDKVLGIWYNDFVYPCQNSGQQSSQCSTVPVPIRALTYCIGVRYGGERDFQNVLDMFQRESVQVERDRLLSAAACSRDTFTLKKLLAMAADINNTVIRLQDKASVFNFVGKQVIGEKVTLDFFMDHWTQLYKDFKDQQTLLSRMVGAALAGNSQRRIDAVERFVAQNKKTTANLDIFKQ
ncbi:peptidase family M1 containing protein, partial [Aphelenchoides avenae]